MTSEDAEKIVRAFEQLVEVMYLQHSVFQNRGQSSASLYQTARDEARMQAVEALLTTGQDAPTAES